MAKFNWSEAQTRAIRTSGSVIVSASAGSGKTTLMIERMLRLLEEGAGIDEMLAVTFAEAQAADMKEKLSERVREKLREDLPSSVRRNLRSAYYRLSDARISTLHAFCAWVVRSKFYLAGEESDFSISNATDTALRRAAACEEAILAASARGDETFDLLYDALSKKRGHRPLARTVFAISDLMDASASPSDVRLATERANATADEALAALTERYRADFARRFDRAAERFAAEGQDFLAGNARLLSDAVRARFGEGADVTLPRAPKGLSSDPAFASAKESLEAIRKNCKDLDEALCRAKTAPLSDQRFVGALLDLTDDYRARYEAAKKRDGALDFHDLERSCLLVLQNEDAANELRGRFRAIFVDEYQDINPVQEAILDRLGAERAFFVGDVKQSIYGFRLCDPSIFRARYAAAEGGQGTAVALNANYRTESGILEFCNFVFDGLMTEEFGGVPYRETARFVPVKTDTTRPNVELHLIEASRTQSAAFRSETVYSAANDPSDGFAREGAYEEGRVIAAEIRALMRDGLGGVPLRYGEIAILCRAVSGTEPLVEALRDAGIPVAVKKDVDLFADASVRVLVDLLRVLQNSRQDYPLLAVMKQLFAYTDEELAEIRLAHRSGAFFEAAEAFSGEDEAAAKTEKMRKKLAKLRAFAVCHTPSELLNAAIRELDYESAVLKRENGASEFDAVRRFVSAVASSVYNTDLATFLGYADADPELPAETVSGDADAVSLMSVHKAKGLEYEVVFLARLGKSFNDADERAPVSVTRTLGVVMRDYDSTLRDRSENRLSLTANLLARYESRGEEARILYVAMTRAKRKLFLVGRTDPNRRREENSTTKCVSDRNALEWILSAVGTDSRIDAPFVRGGSIPKCDYLVTLHREEPEEERTPLPVFGPLDAGLCEEILSRLEFRYPYGTVPAKTTATELNARASVPYERGDGFACFDGDATARGTAYHTAMQRIDFSAPDLEEELHGLVRRGELTEEQRGMLDPERIRAAADAIAPLVRGRRSMRELAFLARFSAQELYGTDGGTVLVQGVADLVVETENGWLLIDYKTTAGSLEYLERAYREQLRIYRDALTRSGYPVSKTYLYSFSYDRLIEILPEKTTENGNQNA